MAVDRHSTPAVAGVGPSDHIDAARAALIVYDACVLVSEMETVTRVLAVTALDVCQRKPAELAT